MPADLKGRRAKKGSVEFTPALKRRGRDKAGSNKLPDNVYSGAELAPARGKLRTLYIVAFVRAWGETPDA